MVPLEENTYRFHKRKPVTVNFEDVRIAAEESCVDEPDPAVDIHINCQMYGHDGTDVWVRTFFFFFIGH